MFTKNRLQKVAKTLLAFFMTGVLVLGLVSCSGGLLKPVRDLRAATKTTPSVNPFQGSAENIAETSPPEVIQTLNQALDGYLPQVAISHPQPDEVLQDNTATVELQIRDLPIFKNAELGIGPYLQVILDNQTYTTVYDLNQPLVIPDLSPGTHTLRVFASRPWGESFKNDGAYAQTTFHIFTKTQENNPDSSQPLLTYSNPQGSYGAEPILLDFYLTNTPLHLVAQENSEDDIADWQIRCTVNGKSFTIKRWEPIYLKGFQPGKNWVQLELLDEQGNSIKNVFNNTARLITYEPSRKDVLSKLFTGELSATEALGIVDPNYIAKETPTTPTTPEPTPSPIPDPESITPVIAPEPNQEIPQAETTVETSPQIEPKKQVDNFFSRFRRQKSPLTAPSPDLPPPTLPEIIAPAPEEPVSPEVEPQPEPIPDLVEPPTITVPDPTLEAPIEQLQQK